MIIEIANTSKISAKNRFRYILSLLVFLMNSVSLPAKSASTIKERPIPSEYTEKRSSPCVKLASLIDRVMIAPMIGP